MSSLLKKLRGRSLGELLTRSRQFVQGTAELYGVGTALPKTPGDVDPQNKLTAFFAPWKTDEDGFRHIFQTRFPETADRIIKKANKIIDGKFDLLGFKDLSFGGKIPDWHFDPISGKHSPLIHWSKINEVSADETGDKKIIWELNRHQYFLTLGQAYHLTGDKRYAEAFDAHLTDWFKKNSPKMGVNWLSSLELAFRCVSWIQAYYFFAESGGFRGSTREMMLKYIKLHAGHIEKYLSTYFSPNTHLTGEALGLYIIGSFIESDKTAKRWREKSYRILIDALGFQIRDDGVYCEQSSHYCRYTADFYLFLFRLRRHQGLSVDAVASKKIERLCEFLMHINEPNGETPLFGDEDGGKFFHYDDRPLTDMRAVLETAALYFDRGDMKYAAGEASPQMMMNEGISGLERYDDLASAIPTETVKAFEDSGFYVMRTDWSENAGYMLIDCGPHGFMNGGHAHADALSFVLDIGGQPLFVDSGTYLYTSDPAARDAFRSGEYHNCLTVDGGSSSKPAGPFSWKTMANARLLEWHVNNDGVIFSGEHDGFEDIGVKYRRSIDYRMDGNIRISDHIKCSEQRTFEVNFILSPQIVPEINGNKVIFKNAADNKTIAVFNAAVAGLSLVDKGKWAVNEHHISQIYGSLTATKRLFFSIASASDIDIIFDLSREDPI